MKVLSILALVLFVSTQSFAEEAVAPAAAHEGAPVKAEKHAKKAKKAKKEKKSKKHAE